MEVMLLLQQGVMTVFLMQKNHEKTQIRSSHVLCMCLKRSVKTSHLAEERYQWLSAGRDSSEKHVWSQSC